jgi:predicted Zn finger-like uncharacterized protein
MRFVCESCRAQYMINDEKVGPKGVKVRCRKCGYVILVKRTDGAPPREVPRAPPPPPTDEDAQMTQVMTSPLIGAGSRSTLPEASDGPSVSSESTGEMKKPDAFFGAADEDEIGAVFDSVLKTGPLPDSSSGSAALGDDDDDRASTRVIDADVFKKLAATVGDAAAAEAKSKEKSDEPAPQNDWYVAINEKQTGPLTLEKIKEHWDTGEVGPDSLCWRPGFGDWLPLSEVKALASVLAPKPPKPIVVAPAPVAPSVVSVPVQSAFSAGGMVQTVQSEVQVPIAALGAEIDAENTSTWKPSAASALASLVKDEMDVLSRPPSKMESVPDEVSVKGLLDLPGADERPANGFSMPTMGAVAEAPAARPPPPANPYMTNPGATYSAPAVTSYRPPSNKGLIITIAVGLAAVLLVLVGLVVWLATRSPTPMPVAAAQPPAVAAPVAATAPTPVVAAPAPTPAAATPPAATPPEAKPAEGAKPAEAAPAQPVPAQPRPAAPAAPRPAPTRVAAAPPPPREEKPVAAAPAPKETPSGGGDDAFSEAFGGGAAPKKVAAASEGSKPKTVYIPPAAGGGGGDVKDSLGQSDIMEVVLANKGGLAGCVAEQKKREPGLSGKLVMKWSIQTSGKTANVSAVSDEFKGTYLAGCIGGLIKGWSFPRHKVAGEPVTFPFKF